MQKFQYKVVPAPRRGEKVKGAKTTEDRFAHALTQFMNELGAEGWEYVRADTLPCEERAGFTGTKTTYQNMLVFRRLLLTDEPAVAAPAVASVPQSPLQAAPQAATLTAQAATSPFRVVSPSDGSARAIGSATSPEGLAPKVGGVKPEKTAD